MIDEDGDYLGIVTAHEVMEALAADEQTDIVALTIGGDPVSPDATLGEALRRLDRGEGAVPVASDDGLLVGWVRDRDVLSALAELPA